jgi:pyruvate/2-oxoglutarate dehydrogenase complex dihydrolipoamide dehydrogenase (E3) component
LAAHAVTDLAQTCLRAESHERLGRNLRKVYPAPVGEAMIRRNGQADDTVAVERFEGKSGRLVRGRATVTSHRTVIVGRREFRASRGLVLATGTQPTRPPQGT